MHERQLYDAVLWIWIACAPVVLVALLFVSAPYGRHSRPGWGVSLPRTVGWLVMESPALLVFCGCFLIGDRLLVASHLVLTAMWVLHYGHRAVIYPFRLRGPDRGMPLGVVLMGFAFNVMNGYLQGRHLNALAPAYPVEWLLDPRFLVGAALFFGGLAMNLHADNVLIALRAAGSYQVPSGGPFRWVSCPNYLGEIIEWIGWAVATWSLAGLAFAAWTVANLLPRALSHHRWYRERFAEYPAERRALVPFLL